MAEHGNNRLKIFGDAPEQEKLPNNRYRIIVRCDVADKTEDWYYANEDRIWREFGDLYSKELPVDGVDYGWTPRDGEAHPDMALVSQEWKYLQGKNDPVVEFVYETLTSSWVNEDDDSDSSTENGLRVVTRTLVALPDTAAPYDEDDIGVSTITSGGKTLYLAGYENQGGERIGKYATRWAEAGVLNRTEDYVGSQKGITIQAFGQVPATPSGYKLARTQESDFEGIKTTAYTFLKPSVLDRSEDMVGSQKAITITAFDETPSTPSGYTLARTQESDFEGIKTIAYTFLKPSVLDRSEDLVGSQKAIVIQAFNEVPATPVGYSLAKTDVSDVEGIPTRRYTFLKPSVLDRSEDLVGSQKAIVIQAFNEVPTTPTGYSLAKTDVSDVEGIPTSRYTFLKPSVLSQSTQTKNNGKLLVETVEAFDEIPSTPSGHTLISEQESDVEGIPTRRYIFAKGEGEISRKVTKRNNGKLEVVDIVELMSGDTGYAAETGSTLAGYVSLGFEKREADGHYIVSSQFAKGDGQIQVSKRPASSSLAGATEVTVVSYGTAVTPSGVLIAESETEEDGYVRYTKTALQGTITGIKQTYKDVVDVRVPGTVSLQSVEKSVGGISGTIAVANVIPPKSKQIAATVEVEITTTPPNTASLAYDLGDISCSVTSISMSENFRGTDTFTTKSGNTRFSGQRKTADMSARVSTYPECYLSAGTSASGTFSYVSSYENTSTSPNSIVTVPQTSTTNTFIDGTGSVADTTTTTGIIRRNSRPILTALDGTTYYEVITWSV